MKKTILLTGGAGYIGSHTATVLLQDPNIDIVVYDNFSASNEAVIKKIEEIAKRKITFYKGDIRDTDQLQYVFKNNDISAVIHFAALKSVGNSCRDPFEYYDNNVTGMVNLCHVMESNGVRNMIFSSSCTVYDVEKVQAPFTEVDSVGATSSPYGTTKLICEQLLRDLSVHKNWNVLSLRYFNPIGAHESAQIGEVLSGTPTNLLPVVLQKLLGKREHLIVFGDDYATPDGTAIRDYIHIMDLAEGHLAGLAYVLENSVSQGQYEVVNLGTGVGTSVLELIDLIEETLHLKTGYQLGKRRAGDVEIAYADTHKANKLLGRKSKRSLQYGIQSAWKFSST